MLDFMMISTRSTPQGGVEIYPKFIVKKSSDLMTRGGDFYAVWVEDRKLWSTDEDDLIQLVDREVANYVEENKDRFETKHIRVKYMWDAESGIIDAWHKYCQKQTRANYKQLDENLIFSNTETTKEDYATKCLPYPLETGGHEAWDKLISTLYSEEEKHKIEWAIGSIVTGDSKKIQKFMVLYGAAGTGKSTILNIIQQLFEGYYAVFDAKALGSSTNQFALESFRSNPLVAIQHDGDLSRIEDNTRINSLVSHEYMPVNEKYKQTYNSRFVCFLFMGTNRPVKITDGKSGLIRRLIDVTPSGNKLDQREYKRIMKQVSFELGAIASHCRDVYLRNPGAYDDYIPTAMLGASNDFYNFVLDSYYVFKKEDGCTMKAAWEMYKVYCDDAKVPYPLSQRSFKEELKNYFRDFNERFNLEDGSRVRSYYSGFRTDIFEENEKPTEKKDPIKLIQFDKTESILDKLCADCYAQYATATETPSYKWDNVTTKLSELDTSKLHYVRLPENHIVIDFDIKDEHGKKSLERNIEEASKWPATYAELSKSGAGVHLHYIYTGDVTQLSGVYDDNIEVKVCTGKSSLRRKLTKCNDLPIANISSGLPLKGDTKILNQDRIKSEKGLRNMIIRNLNKEIHASTKCSIDFIYEILEGAYNSGLYYDVTDLQNEVYAFAINSTNQSDYCIKLVNKMKFKSEEPSINHGDADGDIAFFDIEVFPNLFLVEWKVRGKGKPVIKMINPKPSEIEALFNYKLIGFNNRDYDNHMLYAAYLGYTNAQLYNLSSQLVSKDKAIQKKAKFGEAFNLSYTDIYDFSSDKKSLKKWEIELGIHHQELGLPWDKPVPEELWVRVAEYCENDVIATEAVFEHLAGDWTARQILANLAGMTVNEKTNTLTARIIFGKEKNPKLVYTHLENDFPGYEFVQFGDDNKPHNMYMGEDVGFGGYVYAEPGMYGRTICFDVSGMHPASIRAMNCFGEYTKNFGDLVDARLAIKHKDFDSAKKMLDGRLAPYLDDPAQAKALSQALKIAVNSVYGMTSASFDNPFRDNRNKNNIVALRGALFMVNLKKEIQSRGFTVIHCKTDSIKVVEPTDEIAKFINDYGKKYGYTFEIEHIFEKICLVNDAVYIAKLAKDDPEAPGEWTATGAQFQIPYVFKRLFSKEPITFADMCETKQVSTAIYLDKNEDLPEGEHNYIFVGRVGQFCPIKPGRGGAELVRESKDDDGNVKYGAATGSKGYRWLESETVRTLGKENDIDRTYYDVLVDKAIDTLSKYGDVAWFTSDEEVDCPPWVA